MRERVFHHPGFSNISRPSGWAILARVIVEKQSTTKHVPLEKHPENPERITVLVDRLDKQGFRVEYVSRNVDVQEARKIASRIHARGYIQYLEKLSRYNYSIVDEDTYLTSDSMELAYTTFQTGYELALSLNEPVFYVSRPPGHHAGRGGKAMRAPSQGFCLLNNAGAAVLGFKDRGLTRIAIVDFDVHHGNGTMEIFYDEKILQVDLHQHPDTLYPYTGYPFEIGEGEGYGFKANLVFNPFTGDDVYLRVLSMVQELLEGFNPEALVVSAGFDGFLNDGLSDLRLTEASYEALGRLIRGLEAPTLIILEGGYSVGLTRGVESFLNGLTGREVNYAASKTLRATEVEGIVRINEKTILKVRKRAIG
ncbi:MAG: histone deacetylase family protein [Thermosphaera aggregans]|uniref:histone deacetylase family protein n=1 Tax=Thermosphaera aggregans TaxID=54254 RepID=UPI003C0A7752